MGWGGPPVPTADSELPSEIFGVKIFGLCWDGFGMGKTLQAEEREWKAWVRGERKRRGCGRRWMERVRRENSSGMMKLGYTVGNHVRTLGRNMGMCPADRLWCERVGLSMGDFSVRSDRADAMEQLWIAVSVPH